MGVAYRTGASQQTSGEHFGRDAGVLRRSVSRTKAAIEYLNQFDLQEMPASAQNLLYLLYSLIQVSFPIEVWKQPETIDAAAIRFDRTDPD